MGTMLKWHRDDSAEFGRACRRRRLVETAFSVIRERFGAATRTKTLAIRNLYVVPTCIRYNLVAQTFPSERRGKAPVGR